MRVVLDTNILISGLLWAGPPWDVVFFVTNGDNLLLITDEIIHELHTTLMRAKFYAQLHKHGKTPQQVVDELIKESEIVLPSSIADDVVRDPKDKIILACAVGGEADYIVSGDKDLLVLQSYQQIPILSVQQFLNHIK